MSAIFSAKTKSRFMSHMTFRAFERVGVGTKISQKKSNISSDSLGMLCLRCVLNCVCSRLFCISNMLKEIRRVKNSSRCDDSPKNKTVYVVHSLL